MSAVPRNEHGRRAAYEGGMVTWGERQGPRAQKMRDMKVIATMGPPPDARRVVDVRQRPHVTPATLPHRDR